MRVRWAVAILLLAALPLSPGTAAHGATSDFRKAASEHTAHIMEVSGTLASLGGYRAIYVQGFVKK